MKTFITIILNLGLLSSITFGQNLIIEPPSTEKVKALSIKKRTTKDDPEFGYCFNPSTGEFKINISLIYANHPEDIVNYNPFNEFFIQTRIDLLLQGDIVHIQRNYSPITGLPSYTEQSSEECHNCETQLTERIYSIDINLSEYFNGKLYTCEEIEEYFSFIVYAQTVIVDRNNPIIPLNTAIKHPCSEIFPNKCFLPGTNIDKADFQAECITCD